MFALADRSPLAALCVKVDAFFARVVARHGQDLACRPGCASCCAPGLTVTGVEAAAIRELLEGLDPARRAVLAARSASSQCAALDDDGRCGIYAARPLVCRSHGAPIRTRQPGHLPVVTACELNFTAAGPAAAAPDCIIDQETLSTMLAAVDAAHADASGRARGERVAILDLLHQG